MRLKSDRSRDENQLLRVGIAGFGVVGKRRKLFIDKHPNLEVVAVSDKTLKQSQTSVGGVKTFDNCEKMLNENLDVLFVCLSNDVAAETTIAGLRKGFHVFCEKPPGRSLDDVVRVRQVEQECQNQRLMYGFNHRHHHSVRDAINLITSKKFGRIVYMRGVYGKSKFINFDQTDWRTKRSEAGGGILLDQGIHMLDLMRLFAGEFEEVKSLISNDFWGYDVEDNAFALLRSKSGILGALHSSATLWKHTFNLEIGLELGGIVLSGILSSSKSYGDEVLKIISLDPSADHGNPVEKIKKYNSDPSWEFEISNFYQCIRNNRPAEHGSSWDALQTMKLVEKIYLADSQWQAKI